jgi:hypothetical protein
MGYKSLIDTQVQAAFKMLGQADGLAPAHTYASASAGGSSYDPATGTMTQSIVEYADVPMVLAQFKTTEIDNAIVTTTDMKVLIAALDLPVEPKPQDYIYLSNGMAYMVERILGVPGNSLHILHVRQTKRPG